ncbi:hypothetical protein [Tahibacter amnicola]|uniref:Uncharacterized protein n=1 Tax=Tahibacter amnicola TaxID=2976241 RepID=A0ABY6BKG1_9GAMM|nr:hypothetical protein [Tahibacter amnicola]UXI70508.1 hypothetical protein N4264_12980 [Tahibacter amnicola]
MSETVRVFVPQEGLTLTWPQRCARCGSTGKLVESPCRVGRVKSLRPSLLIGLTIRSDVLFLPVPLCKAHATQNELAAEILEHSPVMRLLRVLAYLGAFMAFALVYSSLFNPGGWQRVSNMGWFLLYPTLSVAAIGAIVWARKRFAVWPERFDPDKDVIVVHFSDPTYAREFKYKNHKVTDETLTESPPWYKKSLLWKAVVIIAFLLFMQMLIHR